MQYVNEFIHSKCASDLLRLGVFPNCKEISESFGAYHALKYLGVAPPFGDDRYIAVVIGDGCTPRTGALIAFKTKWQVISIDPALREPWRGSSHAINRLQCEAKSIEDFSWKDHKSLFQDRQAIIIQVHSHASLDIGVMKIPFLIGIIDIPCCNTPPNLYKTPHICYLDNHILSPMNTVHVWTYGRP